MPDLDDENGYPRERGKEQQCLLMHPCASVVPGCKHFYPYGCTPPEYLLGGVPLDARRADMLLLGCSDARHALFTLWTYGSECTRERRRWDRLGTEERIQLQQQQQRDGSVRASIQTLRFTLNDREPACLARVLLLLQLFLGSQRELLDACAPNASPGQRDAYSVRIALCFNAYYNIYVDNTTLNATRAAAEELLEASATPEAWSRSSIGSIAHIAGRNTLNRLRCMWYVYADTGIAKMKPKKVLDKERKTHHDRVVFPSKNASPILLTGEGPGIAAPKAMEWGTEMIGIHRQYQSWGFLDPFPILREGARSDRKFYYTKTNPAMVATDHQDLDFQVHHNCNPLSAFHHDDVWLPFQSEEEEEIKEFGSFDAVTDRWRASPLFAGPPRVSGVEMTVSRQPSDFEDKPEEAEQYIMSKLVATSLEQLSRMCWAVIWAGFENAHARPTRHPASPNLRSLRPPVDVRLNFVLGDAIDTCDAIGLLSSEGLAAWGKARDGDEPGRVCSFMPNMSLAPCRLELGDLDGPARFDLIDSAYLSDTLGVLNVVMAASPLLKPSPHAVVRTDLRRSGPARKRLTRLDDVGDAFSALEAAQRSAEGLDAKGNKNKMKNKEMKKAAAAFAALTDEDWCTTRVNECALLLGVTPVSGVVPTVGHFHTMLEAARAAKTNKKNAEIGDLGQRLRLAWKQACLIDQRACTFLGSKGRPPKTLHPRVSMTPKNFASMVLPYWLFMTRNLYFESSDCPKVLEGGQQQVRVSPYTPASFARLLSHSLRFLKLDKSHSLHLIEFLTKSYAKGLFGADVVSQLVTHMHLVFFSTSEVLRAPDVVQWARTCPWWDRKPPAEGVIPPGSPGMCRVVMLASEEAVAIVRHLRDPALCVLLHDESAGSKTLISTLHFCFVRVDRGSGAFPQEDKEGAPWFVLKDSFLRVRETRSDDPEAELMVSFLLGCGTIISAKAAQIELELRLQDSATRNTAPAGVAKSLETAEGVIFRTKLSERCETAVVFPTKKANATTLERWLPQSCKLRTLAQDDKGVEPGLGPRRVGKMNRYIIAPGRPEFGVPEFQPLTTLKAGDWGRAADLDIPEVGSNYFVWTLHMANPAARALLADKQMEVIIRVLAPCTIEVTLDAPEKKDGGKGKKKRKSASEDLGRGGVDGGLRCLAVMPFPVDNVEENSRENHGLELTVYPHQDHLPGSFINVLQTVDADGTKLSPPLLSNWAYPVRSPSRGRRLRVCEATKQYVHALQLWLSPPSNFADSALCALHESFRIMMEEHLSPRERKPLGFWHMFELGDTYTNEEEEIEVDGADVWVMMRVEGIIVDESNECLLLDVTLATLDGFSGGSCVHAFAAAHCSSSAMAHPFLDQLLPMAVERGRRTYSHGSGCSYLSRNNKGVCWGRQDGGGEDDEIELMPLCSCGAGKNIPVTLAKALRETGQKEVLSHLYRAVLPTLISVDDFDEHRLKSASLDSKSGSEGGDDVRLGAGEFSHLKEPVEQSRGAKLAYTGPIKEHGNIVESVPAAAVQERGGGFLGQSSGSSHSPSMASGFSAGGVARTTSGGGQSSDAAGESALAGVDEETRRTLSKAGLKRMPTTSAEWVRFERSLKGLPAEAPCPVCNKENATKTCTRCRIVKYCSRECQKKHWRVHVKECYPDK
ncbi:unnamed protein product [Scytosiphon promiscuus]